MGICSLGGCFEFISRNKGDLLCVDRFMIDKIRIINFSLLRRDDSELIPLVSASSLELTGGRVIGIFGPSGCGKSSLLRMLAGIHQLQQGLVHDGSVTFLAPDGGRVAPSIGLAFQDSRLLPWRTVVDNVALPLQSAGVDPRMVRLRCEEALEVVGLLAARDMMPFQLSGGMQQRIALARAIVTDPDLLLLDEAFSSLDRSNKERIWRTLFDQRRLLRRTSVLITHDVQEIVAMCQQLVVFERQPARLTVIDVGNDGCDVSTARAITERLLDALAR